MTQHITRWILALSALIPLSLLAQPANDLCANATPVTLGTGACGPTVTATNTSATGTAGNYCAPGTPSTLYGNGDIWFSFVPATSGAFLDLSTTVGTLFISVYDACGGVCVYQNNALSTTSDEFISGLTPGATYYIQMYESGNNAFGTIQFCMYNSPPPPSNDACANATVVTLGGPNTCGPTVTATNTAATGTPGNYCTTGTPSNTYGGGDIWFAFTPSTATVFLDLATGVGSLYISVYDACGGSCVYSNNILSTTTNEEIPGLTPGNTYYIQMYEASNDAFGTISFCMFNDFPPPANDECANATPVTIGAPGTCGPTVTATNVGASGIAGTACGSTSTTYGAGDIWFSFTATTPTVFLDLTTVVGTLYISVYDACGGNCLSTQDALSLTIDEPISGLTPGQTYYIRMYESGDDAEGPIAFCMYGDVAAPSNDDCANAIPVSVGQPGVCGPTITATNAGASGIPGNVCNSTSTTLGEGDIWFSFTAGTSTVFLDLTTGVGTLNISVYDACGGACVYGNSTLSTTIDEPISGLTPGNTYYIRMYESGHDAYGQISFCMYNSVTPPPNDACANATPVTLGTASCGPTVTATNSGATGTPGSYCTTGTPSNTYGGGDIWFSFVPSETTVLLNLSTGVGSLYISVLDGCSGTCVYQNNVISTTAAEIIPGLTPGQTYYIQMYESGNDAFGTIEFCMLNNPPPPANDECANAEFVVLGNNGFCGPIVSGTNINATGTNGVCGDPASTTYGAGDVWYEFSPSTPTVYLSLSSTVGTLYASVYSDCSGTCVYDNSSLLTSTDEVITGLQPGGLYYLRVYESGNNVFGTFSFCMYNAPAPPANDECANATSVSVGSGTCGQTATGTNVSATGTPGTVCGNNTATYGDGDVWFTFTAIAPTVTLDLGSTVGTLYLSVYSDCSGTCVYDNNALSTTTNEVITGLTPGQTYYLRIYESGNNAFGAFDFCLSSPAPDVSTATGCTPATGQVVDGSGSPSAIDFFDASGNIIASIDNSQNLGLTNVSLYNTNGLRQNGSTYYLGRNVTIQPTTQPTRPIGITIYATAAEINDIIAVEPTVNTINDLAFVKVNNTVCSPAYPGGGAFLPISAAVFGSGYALSTTVSSFSEFFVMPSTAPLPVELTRFSARAEGTRNVIEWAAATEQDLATYTVERADGADFARFTPVADVAPRGTTSGTEAVYSAYDAAPARVSYYRLKATDLDGSVDYSDVVAVTRSAGAPGVKLYPNPSAAGTAATIALAGVDEVDGLEVTITDAAGRTVARVRYAADGAYELPLGALPAGIYTVSSVSGAHAFTQRLVIQ